MSLIQSARVREEPCPGSEQVRLVRVVGMTLEARGILAPVGALCRIESTNHESFDAEVVGFHDDILYLMPFTDPSGAGPGARVRLLVQPPRRLLATRNSDES